MKVFGWDWVVGVVIVCIGVDVLMNGSPWWGIYFISLFEFEVWMRDSDGSFFESDGYVAVERV